MTDQLRLGTLGDEILQAGPSIPPGGPLQGGITIPTPFQIGADDLPCPPHPLYGDDVAILYSGATIPIP